jgi:hypothetical protein
MIRQLSLLSSLYKKTRRAQSADGLVLQLRWVVANDLHRPRLFPNMLINDER